jgi:hypothetical protein
MSRLGDDNEDVIVIPKIGEKTKYNTWRRVDGEPVLMEGVSVQPFNAGTQGNLEGVMEDRVNDQFQIRGPGVWPGGVHSQVEWRGKLYDQIGEPKQYRQGYFTKHFVVRIASRGAEVK